MRQSWRKATRMAPGFVLAQFDSFSSVQMPCSKRSTWRLVRNLGTLRCHILAALPQQLLWQTVRPGAAKSQQPNRQAIRLPGKHNVRSRAGFTSNLHTSLHPHRRQPVDRHTMVADHSRLDRPRWTTPPAPSEREVMFRFARDG